MATNYIRELGVELEERLHALEEVWREGSGEECDTARAAFIKFVKEKALESYRNGLNAVSLQVDTAGRKLQRAAQAT